MGSRGSSHVVLVVRPVMLAPAGAWQHNGNDWHVERSSQGSQEEGSLASETATNMRLVPPAPMNTPRIAGPTQQTLPHVVGSSAVVS